MAIVDRSFSDLYEVALYKFHGYLAVLLFKLATCGWDSSNDKSFYKRGLDSDARKAEMLKLGLYQVEQDAQSIEPRSDQD